jgi:hypothetical protein
MDHTAPYSARGIEYGMVQFIGTFNAPAANGTTWLDDIAVSTHCIGVPVTPAVSNAR